MMQRGATCLELITSPTDALPHRGGGHRLLPDVGHFHLSMKIIQSTNNLYCFLQLRAVQLGLPGQLPKGLHGTYFTSYALRAACVWVTKLNEKSTLGQRPLQRGEVVGRPHHRPPAHQHHHQHQHPRQRRRCVGGRGLRPRRPRPLRLRPMLLLLPQPGRHLQGGVEEAAGLVDCQEGGRLARRPGPGPLLYLQP